MQVSWYPNSYFIRSTCSIFKSSCHSIVFFRSQLFFVKISRLCLHRVWRSGWPKVAKLLLVFRYFDIATRTSRNIRIRILPWRSEFTLINFQTFFQLKQALNLSFNRSVDRLNVQTNPSKILFLWIFKLLFLYRYRFELFRQCLNRDFLCSYWVFVKTICCMSDQFCSPLLEKIAVPLSFLFVK